MKGVLLKKLLLTGSYLLVAVAVEVITFLMMGFGAFPQYALLDLACMLIVAAVIFAIPSFTAQTVVILALLVLQCLISAVNQVLYDLSGYVFIISMFSIAGEATGAFMPDYLNIYLIGIFLLILIAETFFTVFVCRGVKVKSARRGQTVVLALFLAFFVAGASELLYFVGKNSFVHADPSDPLYIYKDDGYLYDTQFLTAKAFKTFGTFSFYYKNFANYVGGASGEHLTEEDTDERLEALRSYFAEGTFSSQRENLDLLPYGGDDRVLTGALEGQNVVLIVIESGEWYGINETYTPTLFALASQGVAMTEYYARDKTNHSEALSILGSYPIEDRNTTETFLEKDLAFSLPNIVRSDGYTTNYFHAGNKSFYLRDKLFGEGAFGFDHAGFSDTLDKMNGYYEKEDFYDLDRDSELLSQYLADFTRTDGEADAFYTQLMSLTSHGTYNDLIEYGNYSADWTEEQKAAFEEACDVKEMGVYYERIDGYPQTEDAYVDARFAITASETEEQAEAAEPVYTDVYLRYKRYQAGLMDLDVGVNRLLHELDRSGELDNTTFFFYADHNAYYSDQQYELKNIPLGEEWRTDLYNIPFFFWSGKYMPLTVSSNLYDGVQYEKTDLTEAMMEQSGLTSADFYAGEFYYTIGHTAPDDSLAFLSGKKIEKCCNSFDVLPTILDLLGYEYNTQLYHGVSVFDAAPSVFVSRESGMFDQNYYTDGDRLYIRSEESENGSIVTADGGVRFYTDADGQACVSIDGEYGVVTYFAEGIADYLHLEDGYVVYEINNMFHMKEGGDGLSEDRRELLSADAYAFLVDLSAYYARQEQFEEMYFLDYFRYEDIGGYVRKAA